MGFWVSRRRIKRKKDMIEEKREKERIECVELDRRERIKLNSGGEGGGGVKGEVWYRKVRWKE